MMGRSLYVYNEKLHGSQLVCMARDVIKLIVGDMNLQANADHDEGWVISVRQLANIVSWTNALVFRSYRQELYKSLKERNLIMKNDYIWINADDNDFLRLNYCFVEALTNALDDEVPCVFVVWN